MKLKSVRIFGFKTFAERVEFDLNADIIAIVGPNGCGKSNIVDAILWGLGEPNARNLRASSGVDVIFNGSAKRKPLGFAEVTLLFDNEDGSLPLDAAEVAITRKVNRAGESHFSINRRACRLKDIYDLLADSGLGRAGYAIVGQSEIDQALSASAEERRAWIDEAAGVQRFRSKRVESLRRLEAARDHLSRIDQILADIEFQREPLREEAEVAKRYQEIRCALEELETNLLVNEIQGAQQEFGRIGQQRGEAQAQHERAIKELQTHHQAIEENGAELAELERRLDALRELRQSQLSGVERAESAIALARQRLESLEELEKDLKGAQDESVILHRDAEHELAIVAGEIEGIQRELSNCQASATQDVEALQLELNNIEASLESAKALEAQRVRHEAEASQAIKRLTVISEEAQGVRAAIADLRQAIGSAQERVDELNRVFEISEAALAEAKDEALRITESQAETSSSVQRLGGELSMLEGRRAGLEATLETLEGLGQGARAVMDLVRSGELEDDYIPILTAIEVSEAHAVAIETALGGAAHDLITPHVRDAKVAIELLKRKALGRATFQPLNLVRPAPSHARALRGPGIIGVAADLVSCVEEHRPVVEALLGRIVVVESLDDSIRLANTKGWSRLVTLDGEVVHSGGAVTGGRSGRQGTGIVQRRSELAALVCKMESQRVMLDQALKALAEADSKLRTATEVKTDAAHAQEAAQAEVQEASNWLIQLQRELASTEREGDRLDREKRELEAFRVPEGTEIVDLEKVGKDRDKLLGKLAAMTAEAEAASDRKRELNSQLTQAELRRQAALGRVEKVGCGTATRAERLSGLAGERADWEERIKNSTTEKDEAQGQADQLRTDLETTQALRKELLSQGYRLSEEAKDTEESMHRLDVIMNKLELERARCDSRRTAAAQRLLEDYAISEDDAMRLPTRELPDDAQPMVSRLRRDLKNLGDVNLGAIEAFSRLSSRFIELDAQREDVRAGMEELQGAVKELDRLTRDRFLSTFEQVKTAFAHAFAELFGGGEAELVLTNTEEVISAGVAVNVTIPGKKRQRLELLSGGERSMSAVAFLFALLRVKPSPLVVLDEVDAPLDGRNVERFAEILRSFAGITQFLVITHNPVTIEAAPLWFGVTMQEPGCTAILPYTVPEEVVAASLLQV